MNGPTVPPSHQSVSDYDQSSRLISQTLIGLPHRSSDTDTRRHPNSHPWPVCAPAPFLHNLIDLRPPNLKPRRHPLATRAPQALPGVLADVGAAFGAFEAPGELAGGEGRAHPGEGGEVDVCAGFGGRFGEGGVAGWWWGAGFVREEEGCCC
jgi:hypothetical protein